MASDGQIEAAARAIRKVRGLMIWFIVSLVIGAAIFGGQPHVFSSSLHFATEAECNAYLPADAEELEAELKQFYGLVEPYQIKGRCAQDPETGKPA